MKTTKAIALAASLCMWTQLASAVSVTPTEKRIDLAGLAVDEVATRPGGRDAVYTFVLENVIPRLTPYDVDIAVDDVGIPPLTFPGGTVRENLALSISKTWGRSNVKQCQDLIDKMIGELVSAKTEIAVRLIGEKAIAGGSTCASDIQPAFESATRQKVDGGATFPVKPWQTVTVTVRRPGGDAKWTVVYPGTPRGEWRTSYGFFFVPDRDERFFTKEEKITDKPSKFTIQKQPDREEFDFVPTVLFTFLPSSQRGKQWSNGWVAGLGYDLEKPFVLGGYAGTYNENVVFTAGVAFHRQSRLRGRYSVKDEVSEALEPDQLVEDTYGPNIYVGVGFRFGEDIHARRNEQAKETAKAQAEAAAAKAKLAQAEKEAGFRKAECEAKADAAEAAARLKCKEGDDSCVKAAAADAAAAKAKCPITELDRIVAEKAAADARADAEKALKRKRCEDTAKAELADAVAKCADKPATCKTEADAAFARSNEKCLKTE